MYEYPEDDAYEMMDDGAIVKSPHNTQQQIQVHRSGSIHISSLANDSNNTDYRLPSHPQPPSSTPPTAPYGSGSNHSHPTSTRPSATSTNTTTTNDNSMVTQLGTKIRRQAGELQRLQAALTQANAYSRLCEQRVCDLHPNHPLPITTDALGVASPQGSRSHAARHHHNSSNNKSGGNNGVAKLRREKVQLEQANTVLERQLTTARTKVTETTRNLKEVRTQATSKDREILFQRKKITKLEGHVQHLEVNVRSALGGGSSASPIPAAHAPLPTPSEAVQAENTALNNELVALRQSLQSEARTSEEQRVYIAVLESAVQAKANEMGLDKGSANLLTKLARLQGELAAKSREQEQSESALKAFEVEMEDIRKRDEYQAEQSNAQENKIHQLSDRLTQFGRGEDDLLNNLKNLESEKTALLDYVEDNAARVADLSHQVQRLESEKLDNANTYQNTIRQHKQKLSEVTATTELLQIKTTESQGAYESATQNSDALRTRVAQLQTRSNELEEEVQQHAEDNTELREVQNELLETIRDKTSAASASARELAMLRREHGSSEGEISTLESKLNLLQIRMVSMDVGVFFVIVFLNFIFDTFFLMFFPFFLLFLLFLRTHKKICCGKMQKPPPTPWKKPSRPPSREAKNIKMN